MWYLIEIWLYKWLVVDVLGQSWFFLAALAVAVVVYIYREVTR